MFVNLFSLQVLKTSRETLIHFRTPTKDIPTWDQISVTVLGSTQILPFLTPRFFFLHGLQIMACSCEFGHPGTKLVFNRILHVGSTKRFWASPSGAETRSRQNRIPPNKLRDFEKKTVLARWGGVGALEAPLPYERAFCVGICVFHQKKPKQLNQHRY